jgi:hypothetical protein
VFIVLHFFETLINPYIKCSSKVTVSVFIQEIHVDWKESYRLVETFNLRPNEFKYMSVIAELEAKWTWSRTAMCPETG